MSRNTYHSSVKIAFALKMEKNWIHPDFLKKIPASTLHYWKKENKSKYLGHQFASDIDSHLDNVQNTFHSIVSLERSIFFAYVKLKIMLFQVLGKQNILRTLSKNKEYVVQVLDSVSTKISVKEISHWFNVPLKTLYHWKSSVQQKCTGSPLAICIKRHPNQTSLSEVKVMKQMLMDPQYKEWSIAALWGFALKNGKVKLSLATWYRYNTLLGLRNSFTRSRKPKYKPLRAAHVHQIWHLDITVFKTMDNVRHYIYTVIDNYSRKNLSWRLKSYVSAQVRIDTIKEALNYFPYDSIRLVTDGGPENDNISVKEFIKANKVDIHHQIALRDIVQSNSMVEASYRTLKYKCLSQREIANGQQLQKVLEEYFYQYNFVRPHYALGIYTPHEVEQGADLKRKNQSQVLAQAAIERRLENQKQRCQLC